MAACKQYEITKYFIHTYSNSTLRVRVILFNDFQVELFLCIYFQRTGKDDALHKFIWWIPWILLLFYTCM